ncbi:MAG: undecaprenyl/decaprenyl-phosphate alpha-N-acetylglucosaminyl 1-phosphate transferase [Gammaproteobacteria bacterium]
MGILAGILIALFATSALIYVLGMHAHHVGLVDSPEHRKIHEADIPTIGGIAIFAGFMLALLTLPVTNPFLIGFVLPALLLVGVGVLDDVVPISHKLRLILQLMAGLLMTVAGGVVLDQLGALLLPGTVITLGVLAIPFTLVCLLTMINAVNMTDGIDGLAGLLTLVAVLGLGTVAYVGGQFPILEKLSFLGVSLIVFLAFNARFMWRKRAVIFLGDSGSTFLGFALIWFAVTLSQGEQAVMTPVTVLWFIAVPLFDMLMVFTRRVIKKQSPFAADREHLHHLFLAAGYSVGQTVVILTAVALMLVGAGIAGLYYDVPENIMFILFLGLFAGCAYLVSRSWTSRRFMGRTICRRTWLKCSLAQDRRRHSSITDQESYQGADRRSGEDRRKQKRPDFD